MADNVMDLSRTPRTRLSSLPRPRPIQPTGPRTPQSQRAYFAIDTNITSPVTPMYSPGPAAPMYLPQDPSTISPSTGDKKVMPPGSEVSSPRMPHPMHSASPARPTSPNPVAKLIPKAEPFTTPPPVSLDTTPVSFKSISLEAALWTFSSRELQDLVSRSIRTSAKESFIRLLSLENLDKALPAELERLEQLKTVTQSRYRFLVHRRNMFLRGLNSSGSTTSKDNDGVSATSKLTSQLCQNITECDQTLAQLVQIHDQMAQINKLLDGHWASTLAIALRKLNSSYGKRTADLSNARKRIAELQAELEDAWGEAEKMAKELDDIDEMDTAALHHLMDDVNGTVIATAAVVSVPQSPVLAPRHQRIPSQELMLSVNALAAAQAAASSAGPSSPNEHILSPGEDSRTEKGSSPPEADIPDNVSIKSTASRKSTRSTRSISRRSTLSAARTRSHRASQNSLRLPARVKQFMEERPPVPDLPISYAPTPSLFPESNAPSEIDGIGAHQYASASDPHTYPPPRKINLDDIEIVASDIAPPVPQHLLPAEDIVVRRTRLSDEIQVVPRKVPGRSTVDDIRVNARTRVQEIQPAHKIPNMWLNADSPRTPTPAERAQTLGRSNTAKPTSYNKLKTLTKRYSLPFPLFNSNKNSRESAQSKQQTRSV
ncbi:hypothetical protein BDN72DRAFT_627196 [Pluteus cervinus]|uniref:Uncharacterized protein n=1 Tax=Pluteus cervinus TaxID=181527 RepID=A0ACD3ATK0_9AGAR|nr:hypothetical protein BDN72DRAFT_627196 [Pluteus cervinus]